MKPVREKAPGGEDDWHAKITADSDCSCPRCKTGHSKGIHQDPDLYVRAVVAKSEIDWTRVPHLAEIFEHRPAVNNYWHELIALSEMIESSRRDK